MLISYCCSSEKVCLHLISWPCLQWMSSSFAYLTNVPSYECTITCWCFRWKERFSGLWKCPMYRVAVFVIFPKGLTNGLSWKIEIWPLFVFCLFSSPNFFWGRGNVCKQANPWFKLKNWHWPHDYTNYTDYTAKITLLLTTVNYSDHTDYIYYTNFTDDIRFIHCTDYCTTPTTLAKIIISFGSPIQSSIRMRLIKLFLLIWLITPTTASTLNYTNSTDCIGYTDFSKVQIYIQFKNGDTWLCIFMTKHDLFFAPIKIKLWYVYWL